MLVVTAGIIEKEGKILISERPPNAHHALEWEFPGGKLEPGEQPEECLEREIREELGFEVKAEDIFKVVLHRQEHEEIMLLCYRCRCVAGEPQPKEGQKFKWVTIGETEQYQFSTPDLPVLDKLRKEMI